MTKQIIVINESETAREFRGFGKDKKGKYRGIGIHDDIAMSTLNVARLFEENDYEEWLYDLFEDLSDSPTKKLISEMLEKYIEEGEIEDHLYKAMYDESQKEMTESAILKMLNNTKKDVRYKPSSSFGKSGYSFR